MLVSNDIGKLFAVLRAAYGHQWPHQSDAVPVWYAKLKLFRADQVMSAASKAIEEHPDFPPSLGQVIKIIRSECVSNFLPRANTYLPPQPYDKVNAEKAWSDMERLAGRKLRPTEINDRST